MGRASSGTGNGRPRPGGANGGPPSWVRPEVAALSVYRSAEGPRTAHPLNGRLRLDWNEASRGPSPHVTERLRDYLAAGALNRYPDPTAARLRRAISRYVGWPASGVQVFNGSDPALDHVVRAFVSPGDHVVIAAPCYDQFRVFAEAAGASIDQVYASGPFATDARGLAARLGPETRLVYVCNPNNPTGRVHTHADLRRLLAALGNGLLVVDEAYFEYWGRTAVPLLAAHPKLVVVRSFSKAFGLAGVRCGYLLAHRSVIAAVDRLRNGKDINALAQVAALAALEDLAYMRESVAEMRRNRSWLADRLRELGWRVVVTPANFILVESDAPGRLVARLKAQGVYVRDRSYLRQLERHVRISVGSTGECRRLVAALGAAAGPAL